MKSRLFGKILVGFIVTFSAISVGVWMLLQLYGGPPEPFHIGYLKRTAPGYLDNAAQVAEIGGLDAVRETISHWPALERRRLVLVTGPNIEESFEHPDSNDPEWMDSLKARPELERVVTGPSGEKIRIILDVSDIIAEIPERSRWQVPNPLIILGVLGALIFSGALAWYLTRPILKISNGFDELSHGNLDFRLGDSMGRRRDEIADLARDFDVMADRLQRLVYARDRLLNDVSHELRSPLARMQLAVGLARQKPDKNEVSLDRIEKEAGRLDDLVGELLTLARVESNAAQHQAWIDMKQLLGRVISDARFEADGAGVTVSTDFGPCPRYDGKMPAMHGNPELLRRAFENVVRNALRHSVEGQVVYITVDCDTEYNQFRIAIADEGPGIDPEKLDALFEPFVRGESDAWGGGFGLGLSIAQRAIRAHGGNIIIKNGEERGLNVLISLPYQMRDAEI